MKYFSAYPSSFWSCLYYQTKTNFNKKDAWRVSQKISLTWKNPALFVSWPRQIKFPEVQPLMSQSLPLTSCFRWNFRFSMYKLSVDLPWLFWIYVLLLNTLLGLHPEANFHLLISSNFLSPHLGIRIIKLYFSELINMDHYQDLLNSLRHVTTWTS